MLRRLTSLFAAALAALALAAPAAVAMPDYPLPSGPGGNGVPAANVTQEPTQTETIRVPGPTVVVEADDEGFDWGSAAIGAGIALGVALLAGAVAMTASRHGRIRTTE